MFSSPQTLPFIHVFLPKVIFIDHLYGPDVVGTEDFELNVTDRIVNRMEFTLWHVALSEEGLSLFYKATFPQVVIVSRVNDLMNVVSSGQEDAKRFH